MSRAFLICPEPVRRTTAGVGTRFLELARVLAEAGHRVSLAIPNDPAEAEAPAGGVTLVKAQPEQLGAQASGHDWVLLHGHLGNHYLSQRDDLPVVVDLYDPFMVENFHYHKELGFAPFHTDHATWRLQMSRGDFFLCSSEEQKLYYLGWLTALGRVHPLNVEADPRLDRLVAELPFGTPEQVPPPSRDRAALFPDLDEGAPLIYFGGIYDWYDPQVLLAAMPDLLEADPSTVVVFVDHPNPDLTPLSVAGRVRATAAERGWLGREVRFAEWQPYEHRFDLAQASDLAVVTHRPGLETDLSLRTRVVDLLWLGLPVVATAGGSMSRVVRDEGAGLVVPAGDAQALTAAVRSLLDAPDRRAAAAEAGRRWAASRRWQATAAPLLDFAEKPWRDRHRLRFMAVDPGVVEGTEPLWNRLRRRWHRLGGSR